MRVPPIGDVAAVADRMGISRNYLRDLIRQGRIAGAQRIGTGVRSTWIIPLNERGLPTILYPKKRKRKVSATKASTRRGP